MAIGGFLLSMKHETNIKSLTLNLIPGVVWAIGNLFMFYSQLKLVLQQVSHYHSARNRFYIRWYFLTR